MAVLRTETFIHELPLRVTPAQERELAVAASTAWGSPSKRSTSC